ncbi:predicted protein [Naegleria gruberi]|uniref:tRNA pseudouridine(55) synthase n=1 Tax=Naegleria gruberi TaxID=5762 RepID=D2VC43_NAEGR|nr:uncharacterized protein NAEGRDRAFT_48341 [Naegleria gruberi]EFC45592.1 predicted protein [Naegleria gruberi]|eukprot:XP_002678336.1 predicted protein [Naegleria gruberi strain NEG-M]
MNFKTKFGLGKDLRVGHGGCLDPSAHGVLMIGVNGQGTKALKYLDRDEKVYDFVIQCGSSTPSYDADTVKFATYCPHYRYFFDKNCQTIEQVNELVNQYLKERNNVIVQKTPVFSAVKIGGKRLFSHGYNNLRKMEQQDEEERKYRGLYCEEETLNLPSRSIRVDRIECTHINKELGQLSFSCTCSTGTYVRILGYEIAHLLEVCGAYVTDLYRTRIGKNTNMLKLDEIGNLE